MDRINLAEKFALFEEHWTPKILADANGQLVKIAKGQGEIVWHAHDAEDELFLVLKGALTIRFRDHEVSLGPGEMLVVPRGVEHSPYAEEETHILLIEPRSTAHTGNTQSDQTVAIADQEWI
ncbi:cupin domain-containing protein [Candidatus Bipolaricaulota bacterium]